MTSSALPSASRHVSLKDTLVQRIVRGFAATLVIALAAHVALPLPFTPVPFTLQPLAVLAVGLLLGPVDGTLALVGYLMEGAAGLPVFSPGLGGLAQLLGPTGGFLMAYPFVGWLAGYGARRLSFLGSYWAAVLSCVAAVAVLFTSGASWLAYLHPMPLHAVWIAAVAPFLPGEAVKILVAAGIYRTFHSSFGR